jgi:hypothetical protein
MLHRAHEGPGIHLSSHVYFDGWFPAPSSSEMPRAKTKKNMTFWLYISSCNDFLAPKMEILMQKFQ